MSVESNYCQICDEEGREFTGDDQEVRRHIVEQHDVAEEDVEDHLGAIPDEGLGE